MKWMTGGLAVLAVGLGLAVGVGLAVSQRAAPGSATVVSSEVAAPSGIAGQETPWFGSLPETAAPVVVARPAASLAERVDRLVASGAPADAYRAWWLLQACTGYRRTGHLPDPASGDAPVAEPISDPAAFCATMTERMKTARIDYLERAARGGIEEALVALVEEGPFGDPSALRTRPDDPLVQEWKARINGELGGRAEQGYWASLYTLFTGFWFDNPAIAADRQQALAYGMALRDIMVQLDGVAEQDAIPFNGPFLDAIGQGLTPEQVAEASTHAATIVARAAVQRDKAHRQH